MNPIALAQFINALTPEARRDINLSSLLGDPVPAPSLNEEYKQELKKIFPFMKYVQTDETVDALQNLLKKVPKSLLIKYKVANSSGHITYPFVVTKSGFIVTRQDVEMMFPQVISLLWRNTYFCWTTNDSVFSCAGLKLNPTGCSNYADVEVIKEVHKYFSSH